MISLIWDGILICNRVLGHHYYVFYYRYFLRMLILFDFIIMLICVIICVCFFPYISYSC